MTSFWDGDKRAYLAAPKGNTDLFVPTYTLHDNAVPSGASTLTEALVTLGALTGRTRVAYARPMRTQPPTPPAPRRARLFRNGANQAVRIPKEFELAGDEVLIHVEDGRLVLEEVPRGRGLLQLLARWKPIDDEFPDVDAGSGTDDEVEL